MMILLVTKPLTKSEMACINDLLRIGKAQMFAEVTNPVVVSEQSPRRGSRIGIKHGEPTKAKRFADACKAVANAMGELNGRELTIKPRGKELVYKFCFENEKFSTLMDDFVKEQFWDIEEMLADSQKPDGISLVASFMGIVLDEHLFNTKQSLHKSSLDTIFKSLYEDSTSAIARLSNRPKGIDHPANQLSSKFIEFVAEKEGSNLS